MTKGEAVLGKDDERGSERDREHGSTKKLFLEVVRNKRGPSGSWLVLLTVSSCFGGLGWHWCRGGEERY